MKKVIIFIGLKIVEIEGVIFLPYWMGRLSRHFFPEFFDCVPFWSLGLFLICVTSVVLATLLLLYFPLKEFIKFNWNLAEKIKRKLTH